MKRARLRPTSSARRPVGGANVLPCRYARPLVLLVVLTAAFTACGRPADRSPAPTQAARRVDAATAGTIAGFVTFRGPVPRNAAIRMASDAYCAKSNPVNPTDETVLVGTDGALQNVFVYVKDGLTGYAFNPPSDPVRIEQNGCRFRPHVLGLQLGQPLELANRDDTLHNVHAITQGSDAFNLGMVEHQTSRRTFSAPEVMVTVKCDVHTWMTAYVGVVPHPYFAVTGTDGRFALKGLPPGEYLVEAWHEKFGTRSQRVRVGAKESRNVQFSFGT